MSERSASPTSMRRKRPSESCQSPPPFHSPAKAHLEKGPSNQLNGTAERHGLLPEMLQQQQHQRFAQSPPIKRHKGDHSPPRQHTDGAVNLSMSPPRLVIPKMEGSSAEEEDPQSRLSSIITAKIAMAASKQHFENIPPTSAAMHHPHHHPGGPTDDSDVEEEPPPPNAIDTDDPDLDMIPHNNLVPYGRPYPVPYPQNSHAAAAAVAHHFANPFNPGNSGEFS